jgi:hypothetical protein
MPIPRAQSALRNYTTETQICVAPQSRMDYFPGQFMSAVLAVMNGMKTSKLSFDRTRSYHKRMRYLT